MKSRKPSSQSVRVPPQLIGIIDDARRANIDAFVLEYSRGLVMPSFSSANYATEIDFEFGAGEEMLEFLRAGATSRHARQWTMRCAYGTERYKLLVHRVGKDSRSPLQVKWSVLSAENDAQHAAPPPPSFHAGGAGGQPVASTQRRKT